MNMQANGSAIDQPTKRKPARLVSANRKFQCSELVMKAYKACGVIKEHARSSSSYTPGHLTQANQDFEMIEGANIGPEQLIVTQERTDDSLINFD